MAGMVFGEEAARGRVVEEIQGLVGRTGAEAVEAMIRSARRPPGSLVILLVWVYYAAQILFFGAGLTQVYARRHGSRIGQAATPKAPGPAAAKGPATAASKRPTPAWAGAVSAGLVSRNGSPPSLVPGLLVSAALLGVGFLGRRLGQRRAP